MQNPFPGIDPYVEAWHRWTDFSITFLCRFSERLLDQLSDGLDARIDWDEYWTTVEDTLPDGKKVLVKTEMRDRTIEVRQRSSRACFTKIVLLSEYQKSDTYDRYMRGGTTSSRATAIWWSWTCLSLESGFRLSSHREPTIFAC